jgi:hypothetical protein
MSLRHYTNIKNHIRMRSSVRGSYGVCASHRRSRTIFAGVREAVPESAGEAFAGACFVVGAPAGGLEGWRLTHREAQTALLVARCRPWPLTRYGDVALLAAALGDATPGSLTFHGPGNFTAKRQLIGFEI